MKAPIGAPLNHTQRRFNELCELGGGPRGGPARGKVLELLSESGRVLNQFAYRQTGQHLGAFPDANPWHVCFAVALCWGHLAKLELAFTAAVVGALADWNSDDLKMAQAFHQERGPKPIEQSLIGANALFSKVTLPAQLPETLKQLERAQERWLSPVLNPTTRPPYIGAWNATAMFMVALFAKPDLAATQLSPPPMLPPGGPIHAGLALLRRCGIVSRPPAGSTLDDAAFEPGALYENNGLLAELCGQRKDWCLIDVHSGIYMLGTRHSGSDGWIS